MCDIILKIFKFKVYLITLFLLSEAKIMSIMLIFRLFIFYFLPLF